MGNEIQPMVDNSPPTVSATSQPSIKKIQSVVDNISLGDVTPEECCERAGISLSAVYGRLSELMSSTTVIKTRYDEMEVPDNKTRLAAVTLVLELRKHIKDRGVVTQVGIFNDPRVVAEAERVLGLRRDGVA